MPDWAVGRSALEVAQIAQDLRTQVLNAQPRPQVAPPPAPANPYAPIAPTALTPPTQDDYAIDPYAATQRHIAYVAQTQFAPALQQATNNTRLFARSLGELRHADDFKRYGPEIDMMIGTVDPAQCTPELIDRVVEIVRARHLNEIVEQQAQARVQQMIESGAVLRSGTAGAPTAVARNGVSLSEAQLPPGRRALLERFKITDTVLDEMLRKMDPEKPLEAAREEWFKLAAAGDVIVGE